MQTPPAYKTLLLAAAASLALAACDRQDNRTAGQKLDSAVAQTEQRADQAKSELKKEGAEASAALQAGTDRAATGVENAAGKAAEAVGQAANQVAAKTNDAAITTQINAELAKDPGLSALRIDVDTRDGGVTLSGTAPSLAAKDRATRLASAIKGVTRVDNRLDVRS